MNCSGDHRSDRFGSFAGQPRLRHPPKGLTSVEQTKTGKLFSISDIDCGCATEGGCAAQRLNLNLFDLRRATCLMDLLKLSPKVFAFSVSN